MSELLEATNITKRFGGLIAVNGVSLSVSEGETVGLIGPNGAGKTTLVNILTGVYRESAGDIKFRGENINKLRPHERCKLGMSRTYQIPRPYPELTAVNSVAVSVLWGQSRPNQGLEDALYEASLYLEFVGLFSKRNVLARDLTFYEQRMLELARALATHPKLIFLDEPMAGLNPFEASRAVKLVMRAKEEFGVTILWIEHVMGIIMEAAQRLIVLHYGAKIAEGIPEQVSADRTVIDAYLGSEYA
jgi:branched-chain amino acid transport system ATP-binding protein